MDIQEIMKKAQAVQDKMADMSNKLADLEVEGTAGGGMLVVIIDGKGDAKKVRIDPSIVNADDVEMIEDLTVAAFNDAKRKLEKKLEQEMEKMKSSLGLPPGMSSLF